MFDNENLWEFGLKRELVVMCRFGEYNKVSAPFL